MRTCFQHELDGELALALSQGQGSHKGYAGIKEVK